MVLGRFVGGFGWFWVVLGGFGWFWVVLGGFGWFRVLVTTYKFNTYFSSLIPYWDPSEGNSHTPKVET